MKDSSEFIFFLTVSCIQFIAHPHLSDALLFINSHYGHTCNVISCVDKKVGLVSHGK